MDEARLDYERRFFDKIVRYSDGVLRWKVGTRFGREAGTVNNLGYKVFKYQGNMYSVHRVIYLLMTGTKPEYVDHIDGNKLNNYISNLRKATPSQNQCNQKRSRKNTTGHKNVFFVPRLNKYRVRVQFEGQRQDLGYFDDLESASVVAEAARNKIHKEFARHE